MLKRGKACSLKRSLYIVNRLGGGPVGSVLHLQVGELSGEVGSFIKAIGRIDTFEGTIQVVVRPSIHASLFDGILDFSNLVFLHCRNRNFIELSSLGVEVLLGVKESIGRKIFSCAESLEVLVSTFSTDKTSRSKGIGKLLSSPASSGLGLLELRKLVSQIHVDIKPFRISHDFPPNGINTLRGRSHKPLAFQKHY